MWSAALVAGGWLTGCASGAPDKASAETKKRTPIPSLEEFTTVGKPTKTIETPNGPVEIYDPLQDSEVRAAFGRIHDKGFNSPSEYYFFKVGNTADNNSWYLNNDVKLLFKARDKHYKNLVGHSCQKLETSSCGTTYNKIDNQDVKVIVTGAQSLCSLNNQTLLYSVDFFPIGERMLDSFNQRAPKMDYQLSNFFGSFCISKQP